MCDVVDLVSEESDSDTTAHSNRTHVNFCASADDDRGWLVSARASDELHAAGNEAHNRATTVIKSLVDGNKNFMDSDFPPRASSICGRSNQKSKNGSAPSNGGQAAKARVPKCLCGAPAKLCTVWKDGMNQGRLFWGCPKRDAAARCKGMFSWADDAPPTAKDEAHVWRRFPLTRIVHHNQEGLPMFKPDDVVQGRVGDCWFLAALALLAERRDLLSRILPNTAPTSASRGYVQARLFIDGRWRLFELDDHLPCLPRGQKRGHDDEKGELPLSFSRGRGGLMWVPLLEKAYAKAHGSYKSISGGWIAEALFDLTSLPTESLWFAEPGFDPESFWARLLGFVSERFLVGANCQRPSQGSGLVGGHAYSLLDARELVGDDARTARQPSICEFFGGRAASSAASGSGIYDAGTSGRGDSSSGGAAALASGAIAQDTPAPLRLVRVRNPWGKREWKGSFSSGSEQWSARLRSLLPHSDANDGTCWMPFSDFIREFEGIDVCKAHRDWHAISFEAELPAGEWHASSVFELRVTQPTWLYLTVAQANKRGKARGGWVGAAGAALHHTDSQHAPERSKQGVESSSKARREYWYSDISLILTRVASNGRHVELMGVDELLLHGQRRVTHAEMLLADTSATYLIIPFSATRGSAHGQQLDEVTRRRRRLTTPWPAQFTLRCFSANPVSMRARPGSRALTLRAVHDAILHVAQLRFGNIRGGRSGSLRVRELWRDDRCAARIVLVQSSGAALVFAQNHTKQILTCQFVLHGSAVGATSADMASSSGVPMYTVQSAQQAVIAAVANVPDQDYEGTSAAAEGFALDGFGVLLTDCRLTGEASLSDGCALHSLHAPITATNAQARRLTPTPDVACCEEREDSALQAALAASLLDGAQHAANHAREQGDSHSTWHSDDANLNAAIVESLSAGRKSGDKAVVIID